MQFDHSTADVQRFMAALVEAAIVIQKAGDASHPDLSLAARNFLIATFEVNTPTEFTIVKQGSP